MQISAAGHGGEGGLVQPGAPAEGAAGVTPVPGHNPRARPGGPRVLPGLGLQAAGSPRKQGMWAQDSPRPKQGPDAPGSVPHGGLRAPKGTLRVIGSPPSQ